MLEIKTHFVQGDLYTACGLNKTHVDTTPHIKDVTCKSCLRTSRYKRARTRYYDAIIRDDLAFTPIGTLIKNVWNKFIGIFK